MEAVCAQAYVVLAFADGAILLAGAMFFRLVAHHADDGTGHGSLQGKLYLTMATRGKARVESMQQVCLHAGSVSAPPAVENVFVDRTFVTARSFRIEVTVTHKIGDAILGSPSAPPFLYWFD